MAAPKLPRAFLRVTLANFFFFLNFASYFLLPLHVKDLGGSEATVGLVMGTLGVSSLGFLAIVGLTIDRLGPRFFLIGGAFGMTLVGLGFATVSRIGPELYALRLLQGLCFAAAFTATTTYAADLAPREQRAQALGIFGLSTLLTHAIAPMLGEEIVHRFGFHVLFLTTAAYTVISMTLALGLPPPAKHDPSKSTAGAGGFERLQIVIAATTFLAGMGFGTVLTFIATFMREQGLGRVAFFFSAYTGTAILTRLIGAGLSDTFGRRRVIIPTLVGLGLAILLLAFADNLPMLVFAGALFGTSQGVNYPTLHAFLIDHSHPEYLGRAQALFNGSFNFGVTISAFAFGGIAEHYGYRVMFAVAACAPIAAGAVFYAFGRTPPEA